ncbi:NAD(P)/FAD-dependent oxidoreductase [Embleya sp. NPDC005971]|uniref:flavin monoamine oxidase family protein n=1 Tax=Embleya sp. NPDC005971 TaxID=3156724 RepID=UPI003409C798
MWDVVVVGAGVGGCHLARRLQEGCDRGQPGPAGGRVALFEASHRVGGRLWSSPLPDLTGPVAEFGAMRFDRSEHHVVDLIAGLDLQGDVEPFWFGRPENLDYVRSTRLRRREICSDSTQLPYLLAQSERGLGGDGLAGIVAEAAVPGFTAWHESRDQAMGTGSSERVAVIDARYRRARRAANWRGLGLHEVPWATLVDAVLTPEAAALAHDTGGYDRRECGGSAAGQLDGLFQAVRTGPCLRLRGGFQALPATLHRRFAAAGGRTFLGHRLVRMERASGEGGYRLTFLRSDAANAHVVEVRARSVVFALPTPAVRKLEPGVFPPDTDAFRRGLDSTYQVPAVKVFLRYPTAWWCRLGLSLGRSTTDLPNRQLWYWDSPDHGDPGAPGALLAVYADGSACRYWTESDGGPRHRDRVRSGPGAADHPDVPGRLLVESAHAMVREIHGVPDAPPPDAARWRDWSVDPYGGAWPVWRAGYDPDRVIPTMRRPLPGEPVFWVNDSWTPRPGSVQGVLESAERILREHFGLPRPGWLRPDPVDWDIG